MSKTPDFSFAKYCSEPFAHAWIPRIYSDEENHAIYSWLESNTCWGYTLTSFYEQYEFSLQDVVIPPSLKFLTSKSTVNHIARWLESSFAACSLELTDIVAHCLHPDHKIDIHNDYVDGGESHRLLLQLSEDIDGGETLLFKEMDARSLTRIVRPIFGTAFAFGITPESYHAVSKLNSGRRYTIIYSYNQKNEL